MLCCGWFLRVMFFFFFSVFVSLIFFSQRYQEKCTKLVEYEIGKHKLKLLELGIAMDG